MTNKIRNSANPNGLEGGHTKDLTSFPAHIISRLCLKGRQRDPRRMNIGIEELESNFTPLPPALAAQCPGTKCPCGSCTAVDTLSSLYTHEGRLALRLVQQLGVPVKHSNVGWFDVAVDPSQPICART